MDEILEEFKTMLEQFKATKLTGHVSLQVNITEGVPTHAFGLFYFGG